MSLRSKWENKLKGARAAGIEIFLQGGAVEMSYVLLERKRSRLEIASSGSASALSELKLSSGTPVNISISGKGIIHKKVTYTEDLSALALLQKALPNAKLDEFYVQHTQPVNDHVIVSVARKSTVDELLDEFRKMKLEVVSCTFGPFSVSSLFPLMNFDNMVAEEIRLPAHTVTVVDGQVDNYSAEENADPRAVEVGGDFIRSVLLVPFAAAAGYFIGHRLFVNVDRVVEQAGEFRQKKIFQLSGAGFLVLLLSILLINYLVFDHYWKKKQAFEMQYAGNQDALQKYAKLSAEYEEKMSFLKGSGLLETSRSSFYADRIAMDMPSSILLTEMNINPREKRSADENAMEFKAREIHIQGNCRQSNELNEWIKLLKKKDWVSEVELLNYKQGKGDVVGTFIIGIKTR